MVALFVAKSRGKIYVALNFSHIHEFEQNFTAKIRNGKFRETAKTVTAQFSEDGYV